LLQHCNIVAIQFISFIQLHQKDSTPADTAATEVLNWGNAYRNSHPHFQLFFFIRPV